MDFGAVSLNGYVGGAPAAPILSGSGLLSASEKQDSKDSSFINFEAPHRILKTSANSLPTTMLSFSSAAVDGAAPPETSLFVSQQGGNLLMFLTLFLNKGLFCSNICIGFD